MNRKTLRLIGLLVLIGCPTALTYASDLKTGELWLEKCARCHGDTGAGDTPLGKKLKVTDYSSKKAQEGFTDEFLSKLIREGKVTNGKAVMPAYKDELSSAEMLELRTYIRSLAK